MVPSSGSTTVNALALFWSKSARRTLPTWWALAEAGRTRSSGNPKRTDRKGAPSSKSTATTARPKAHGRRITARASRRQNPPLLVVSARAEGTLSQRRKVGRTSNELTRRPRALSRAGRTTTAPRAAMATTARPA